LCSFIDTINTGKPQQGQSSRGKPDGQERDLLEGAGNLVFTLVTDTHFKLCFYFRNEVMPIGEVGFFEIGKSWLTLGQKAR